MDLHLSCFFLNVRPETSRYGVQMLTPQLWAPQKWVTRVAKKRNERKKRSELSHQSGWIILFSSLSIRQSDISTCCRSFAALSSPSLSSQVSLAAFLLRHYVTQRDLMWLNSCTVLEATPDWFWRVSEAKFSPQNDMTPLITKNGCQHLLTRYTRVHFRVCVHRDGGGLRWAEG